VTEISMAYLPASARLQEVAEDVYAGNLRDVPGVHPSWNLDLAAEVHRMARAIRTHDSAQIERSCDWLEKRLEIEQAGRFMGSEFFSSEYAGYHFGPWAVAACLLWRIGRYTLASDIRGWMLAALGWAALCSIGVLARDVTDHQIERADRGLAGPVFGDGPPMDWQGPFVAWAGPRGGQRFRDRGNTWGYVVQSPIGVWLNRLAFDRTGTEGEDELLAALREGDTSPLRLTSAEKTLLDGAVSGGVLAAQTVYEALVDGYHPQDVCILERREEGHVSLATRGGPSGGTATCYCRAQWMSGRVGALFADLGFRDPGEDGGADWLVPGRAWISEDGRQAWAEREDGRYGCPVSMDLPGGATLWSIVAGPDPGARAFKAGEAAGDPGQGEIGPGTPSVPVGGPPEIVAADRPGKWVVLWSGRARVLGWPSLDGRTMVVCDQPGDEE